MSRCDAAKYEAENITVVATKRNYYRMKTAEDTPAIVRCSIKSMSVRHMYLFAN